MLKKVIKSYKILFLIALIFLLCAVFFIYNQNNLDKQTKILSPSPSQKISGWIAWWKEEEAVETIRKYPNNIASVSPVWFMLSEDLALDEIGSINKNKAATEFKKLGVKVMPTLGTEINSDGQSKFLNDPLKTQTLIENLVGKLEVLEADGVDIDLEGIKGKDKEKFTEFLSNLSKKLKEKNMKLSVAVHAQTGLSKRDDAQGQDLEKIGKTSDEVRVMLYDEHSPGSEAGPISSFLWMINSGIYNQTKIPKEKLVIGIPSYGYVWTKDDTRGLQYDEFNKFLEGKKYSQKRDKLSGELIFEGEDFKGYLSDSESMLEKITLLKTLGYNRFVVWHLGGMDEKIFNKIN